MSVCVCVCVWTSDGERHERLCVRAIASDASVCVVVCAREGERGCEARALMFVGRSVIVNVSADVSVSVTCDACTRKCA